MKLSLRAARKLESKISLHLEENPLQAQAKVRVSADVGSAEAEMDKARVAVLDLMKANEELLALRFHLRQLISDENAKSGIDSLMNQKVFKQQMVSQLKTITNSEARLSKEELQDTLSLGKAKLNNGGVQDRYGRESSGISVQVSVLTSEDIEGLKKRRVEITREIEQIEEKLTELNYSQKIEISKESEVLLQKNNLL